MTIRLLLPLFGLLLLGACETGPNSRPTSQLPVASPGPTPRETVPDTFQLRNGQVVNWEATTAAAFERLPAVAALPEYPYDSAADGGGVLQREAARLQLTRGRVQRQDSVLLFYPSAAARPLRFVSSRCDCDSTTSYRFLGALPQSDYWLAEVGYYEGGDYLLVHQRTGQRVLVDEYPSVSPSGRRIVSAANAYQDIYEADGLSLWQLDAAARPRLSWRRNAPWTPEGLRWADDRTLLIKASEPDAEGNRFTRYLRLRLPQ